MRAHLPRLLGVVAVLTLALWPLQAHAADPRLEEAERDAQAALARVDELLQEIERITLETEDVQNRLDELYEQDAAYRAQAEEADTQSSQQARQLYIHGSSDPGLSILVSDSPEQVAEQARLLQILAQRNRSVFEGASAARVGTRLEAEEVQFGIGSLERQKAELERLRQEAEQVADQELAALEQVREQIAAEEEARRRAEEAARARAARAAPPPGGGSAEPAPGGSAAPVSGGVACPVGQPRNYSDTYGAPRSGGRSHRGTDILAPMNTPIFAYENGTVSRMNSNRLGGISLYLKGDSGNLYYYTHLNGYVRGMSAGQRVTAGQQVALNGQTGNAPVPHLHFEVMPGGGGNVNPYPFVRRACG